MNKKLMILLGVSALLLTACGGGSTAGTDKANGNNQALVDNSSDVSGAAGGDIDLGNGVTIKLSQPQHFTPGQFASNYVKGQTANLFEATVTNGSKKAIDWATVSFVTTTTNSGACPDVLDGDNGVMGQPTDPLAAGASQTFKFGIACDTKPGADLNVKITVGDKSADVKAKLA